MGRITVGGLSPLEILGLSPGAQPGEVASAYRRLAQQAHPDLGGSGGLMALLTEARDMALSGGTWGTRGAPDRPEDQPRRADRPARPARPAPAPAPAPAPRPGGGWRGGYEWIAKPNGNYSARIGDAWVTVFKREGGIWNWVCEGVFSKSRYLHLEDAIDAAIKANEDLD